MYIINYVYTLIYTPGSNWKIILRVGGFKLKIGSDQILL